MAHCAIPVDIPVMPPSYEEAIQTAAPEIPNVETGSNDEPPPSYSEATKDDVCNSSYQASEMSEPSSTSDLAGLIIASIVTSHAHRIQGRQPVLLREDSSNRPQSNLPNRDRSCTPQSTTSQARLQRRKKWSVCLLGAAMGVFLVAGLIAASVLRHKPQNKSNSRKSDSSFISSLTIPTMDPVLWNWRVSTPKPFDVNLYKSLLEEKNNHQSFLQAIDRLHSTPKPSQIDEKGNVFDFDPKSSFHDRSVFSTGKNNEKEILYKWLKKLRDEKAQDKTTPSR